MMIHRTHRIQLAILLLLTVSHLGHAEVTFFGIPVGGTEGPASAGYSTTPASPEEASQPLAETKTSVPNEQQPGLNSSTPPSAPIVAGPRILVIFDVSMTVVKKASETRFPMDKIKQEALNLIKVLPDNASIGVIQFARNYKMFRESLVQLAPENRKAVGEWVDREWVDTGIMHPSGAVKVNDRAIIGVLDVAAKMQPDVIYLISDGSFQWSVGGKSQTVPWKELSDAVEAIKSGSKPVVLNFIGFQTDSDDRRAISSIVKHSGGKITQVSKK